MMTAKPRRRCCASFGILAILLLLERNYLHNVAASSSNAAVTNHPRSSSSSSSSSRTRGSDRNATSSPKNLATVSSDKTSSSSASSSSLPPQETSTPKNWMERNRWMTIKRSSASSSLSTEQPPSPQKPIKSDRDRGWPLWYPRDLEDSPSKATPVETSSSSAPTTYDPSDHNDEGKVSRTLRHALTHYHPDHPSDTNVSTTTAAASPGAVRSKGKDGKSSEAKNASEELTVLVLEPPPPASDVHKGDNKSNKDRHSQPTKRNEAPPSPSSQSRNSTPSETASNTSASQTKPPESDHSTTTTSQEQRNQPQQEAEQPTIIVLGGSPFGTPGGFDDAQQFQRRHPGRGMSPSSTAQQQLLQSNTMIAADVLGTLLATMMKLWFLTWITKRIAMEEEMIHPTQHFVWERLNDRYVRDAAALRSALSSPPLGIAKRPWRRLLRRRTPQIQRFTPTQNWRETFTKTVLVVELNSNDKGTLDLAHFTDIVTFVLQQHRSHAFGTNATAIPIVTDSDDNSTPNNGKRQKSGTALLLQPQPLEVIFLLQSPGGGVGTYGLAAAQMKRLTQEPGITTTACVDMVAASGGYMIASQATKLLAAPFATLGSIGVIVEGLNFYEALQKYGIQPMVIKSGNSKNPLSSLGPVSRKDLDLEQSHLDKVHEAFRNYVLEGRPVLAAGSNTRHGLLMMSNAMPLEKIMDGSIYLGREALDLNLVDAVMTSEEYIMEKMQAGERVLRLHRSHRSRFGPSRRLSPLDLLPHLQGWCRGLIQSMTTTTTSSSSTVTESPARESFSVISLRFLQMASFFGLARQLVRVFQHAK